MNKLYYGDNLDVLRRFIRDETVDLCYIDPPFNSKRNYNQIYNNIGREDVAQAQAFIDTWTWNDHANECLVDILSNKNGVQTAQSIALIQGFESVLGKGSLFAYILNMTVRIAEIHRTLKPTGSFYLHCDSTASHYLKIICDALFCGDKGGQFLNEITWKRKTGRGETNHKSNRFGNSTDTILFYSRSSNNIFNSQYNMSADGYSEYVEKFFRFTDEMGRVYRIADLSSPSPRPNLKYDYKGYKPPANGWAISREKMELWDKEGRLHFPKDPNGRIQRKRFLNELKGKPIQNLWDDIEMISSQSAERLGYPTQKPEALLERIISASSNESDTILDAFCGCGTSIAVAQRLNRRWIGIDITYQSISLIMKRLKKIENAAELVEMHGIPRDMESVRALIHKKDDRVRKEFEKWAVLTFSDNQAVINEKKGADKGVDGVAYTITGRDEKGNLTSKPVIFSVKSGHVNSSVIRDLHGTIEREKAAAGILITMEKPSKPMIQEAKQAGQFRSDFTAFDRLQIVTVEEILDNKRMNLPLYAEMIKQARSDSGANQPGLYE